MLLYLQALELQLLQDMLFSRSLYSNQKSKHLDSVVKIIFPSFPSARLKWFRGKEDLCRGF